jgi:hypothetical protein
MVYIVIQTLSNFVCWFARWYLQDRDDFIYEHTHPLSQIILS